MPTTEDDLFPYDPRYESVRECLKAIQQKQSNGKAIMRWESFLLIRFDEWKQMSQKPCTIIRPEGGKVSFTPGCAVHDPEPSFTFEQILQAAIPLRGLFKTGHEAAIAAEDLLQACHYAAITGQERARLKNEQRELQSFPLSFEDGVCRITGNQRLDRAMAAFRELLQLEQADALFSGLFASPGGPYHPDFPEFDEIIWAQDTKEILSPACEFERYQQDGFTMADVGRLTKARNDYIRQKHLTGKPISLNLKKFTEKACIPTSDSQPKNSDIGNSKPDKEGNESDAPHKTEKTRKHKTVT